MQQGVLTAEELQRRLTAEFPEAFNNESGLTVLEAWQGGCLLRQEVLPQI